MMRHGGNVWQGDAPESWLDFSANLRPEGPPDWVRAALTEGMRHVAYYPELTMGRARRGIAAHLGLPEECALPTSGGIEAIALAGGMPARRALMLTPTFGEYARTAQRLGVPVAGVALVVGEGGKEAQGAAAANCGAGGGASAPCRAQRQAAQGCGAGSDGAGGNPRMPCPAQQQDAQGCRAGSDGAGGDPRIPYPAQQQDAPCEGANCGVGGIILDPCRAQRQAAQGCRAGSDGAGGDPRMTCRAQQQDAPGEGANCGAGEIIPAPCRAQHQAVQGCGAGSDGAGGGPRMPCRAQRQDAPGHVAANCGAGDISPTPCPTLRPLSLVATAAPALREGDALWLCNPSNPLGRAFPKEEVLSLLAHVERAKARLIVDEAFIGFCPQHSVARYVPDHPSLIVVGSLTKTLGMPGVRLGYLAAHPDTVACLSAAQVPWALNCFAAAVAAALPEGAAQLAADAGLNQARRAALAEGLKSLGAAVYPSEANFLLARFAQPVAPIAAQLHESRILLRDCMSFPGIDDGHHLRLAVKTDRENARLLSALAEAL